MNKRERLEEAIEKLLATSREWDKCNATTMRKNSIKSH